VELLQSEKLGPVSERQREVLRDMQASGKRLQQFIQDFLTFSALETGGLKMQFALGNINECLSDVCRLWSGRFQDRGLALYFLANDKLPEFSFDFPKLERVISNLLENSYKFVPQGGTVWLHAEPYMWERRAASQPAAPNDRRRQATSQPNSVKISVADTGPGIPAEFHQEVFDDFFRLPGNENQEGMGLGLAIVRRLVQGMGGKVWVESDPGAGCKFSFLIPFKMINPPNGKKTPGKNS
jgi:signal transduction histidine kinase